MLIEYLTGAPGGAALWVTPWRQTGYLSKGAAQGSPVAGGVTLPRKYHRRFVD